MSIWEKLSKLKSMLFRAKIVENVNDTRFKKHCLILYVISPFFNKKGLYSHQNKHQILLLVKEIEKYGYNVDVVDYYEKNIKLFKLYDLIIDIHPNKNNIYDQFKSERCLVVGYITGSNPSFSNREELVRLDSIVERKGVALKQRRYVEEFDKNIMNSLDAIFFMGNEWNLKTFDEFEFKKTYFIKNTGYIHLLDIRGRYRDRGNFMYLGSTGQVHRGLDLLLEVFSSLKNCQLYVCGNYVKETDFCKLYHKELYKTKNIHAMGYVEVTSSKFIDLCETCTYMILPTCSEGMSGSVLTAMSAGLIPVVSKYAGFSKDEVIILEDCTKECIEFVVGSLVSKDQSWILNESQRIKKIVKNGYMEKDYSASIVNALEGTFNDG